MKRFVSCPMIKLWIFCWLDECVRLYGKTKGTPTHYKYKSCSAIETHATAFTESAEDWQLLHIMHFNT